MPRQRAAFSLFGIGLVMMLGALPLSFWQGWTSGRVWDLVVMSYKDPDMWVAETAEQFIEGPLAAMALPLSYGALLPGAFVLLLASRSGWFCWMSRVFWSAQLVAAGPPVFYFVLEEGETLLGAGFYMWAVGLMTVTAAQWTMSPLRPERFAWGVRPSG